MRTVTFSYHLTVYNRTTIPDTVSNKVLNKVLNVILNAILNTVLNTILINYFGPNVRSSIRTFYSS